MILTGAGYMPVGDMLSNCINLISLMMEFADSREYVKDYKEKKQYGRKLKAVKGVTADHQNLLEDIYVLDRIHRVARLTPVK